MTGVPVQHWLPPPKPSPSSGRTCDPGDPRQNGGAHSPGAPGTNASNTGSSKRPMTPEVQEVIMRAQGDAPARGSGGWKVLTLKYNKRQLRIKQKAVCYLTCPGRGTIYEAPRRTVVTLQHKKKMTILQKPNLKSWNTVI